MNTAYFNLIVTGVNRGMTSSCKTILNIEFLNESAVIASTQEGQPYTTPDTIIGAVAAEYFGCDNIFCNTSTNKAATAPPLLLHEDNAL